jgi:preprotein translocase SecE subunit
MKQHTTSRRTGPRIISYIGEIINELQKVVWLTRREIAYLTVLVLIVSIIAGIVLGAVDYGFSDLVDKVFLGR